MNPFLFFAKRMFHTSNAFAKRELTRVGLTPSRFDMLYLIGGYCSDCRPSHGTVPQREVRRFLGVTSATVSRMLNALVELGLVVRERAGDRRRCLLALTEVARQRVEHVVHALIYSERIDAIVDTRISRKWWPHVYDALFLVQAYFAIALACAAEDFGDTSTCPYGIRDD